MSGIRAGGLFGISRRELAILVIVLAVGGWLRFYGIGAKSVWLDEGFSWQLSQFTFKEIIARTGEPHTVHPPAYFMLLRLWTGVWGQSAVAARSLAAVAGMFTILGVFFLARELQWFLKPVGGVQGQQCALPCEPDPGKLRAPQSFSRILNHRATQPENRVPMLAAALVALSVLQIHASQQIRHYSIGSALFVGLSIALLCALRRGHARFWFIATVVAVALCYTHHLAFFQLAALYLFVTKYLLFHWGKPDAWKQATCAILSLIFIVVGYIPWLPYFLGQLAFASKADPFFPIPTFHTIIDQTSFALTASFVQVSPIPIWLSAILALVMLLTLFFLRFSAGWPGRFLCMVGLIPPVLLLSQSFFGSRGVYTTRLLTFSQLIWLMAIAFVIARIPHVLERRMATAIALLVATLLCVHNWQTIGPSAQPGVRAAMAQIMKKRTVDEPVVARTVFIYFGANFHSQSELRVRLCGRERNRFVFAFPSHVREEDVITVDEIQHLKSSGVWFITTQSYVPNSPIYFDLPADWRLDFREVFSQADYSWELAVTVEHYVIGNALPMQKQKPAESKR